MRQTGRLTDLRDMKRAGDVYLLKAVDPYGRPAGRRLQLANHQQRAALISVAQVAPRQGK